MGIEIPDPTGALAGRSFIPCSPSRLYPLSTLRRCSVDVQNTLVINALLRWGSNDQQIDTCRAGRERVGAYALSEAGSGSDAFALTTRAVESGTISS
jgi:hypothetical protein